MPTRLTTIVLLALLLATSLAPAAASQRPTFPASYLRADVTTSTGFVEIPRESERDIGFTLNDRSGDSGDGEGFPHQYVITAEIETPGTVGWSVTANPSGGVVTSGESVHGVLTVRADPVIRERTITVSLNVELQGQDGRTAEASTPVQVRVAPYHQGQLRPLEDLGRMSPQEAKVMQLEVQNDAPYPDTYDLDLSAPQGWTVHAPDQVSLRGQETTRVDAIVIAPHEDDRFYYRESGLLRMEASSVNDPTATTLDESAHPLRVEGVYLPPYTLPFFPLAALLAGAFVHRRRKAFHRSRKEKGPPREPELPPRKQALLAELKERNPEAHRRLREKLDRELERRKERYPDHKEAQLAPLSDGDEGEEDPS